MTCDACRRARAPQEIERRQVEGITLNLCRDTPGCVLYCRKVGIYLVGSP